jgi:hypothetical protein
MDLITVSLKRAFREPGCPVCRLRHETERRYISSLLYESVTDSITRQRLVRSLGFCPQHTWLCQAIEQDSWGDGMGTGIIYEDLTRRIRQALTDQLTRSARFRRQRGAFVHWMDRAVGLGRVRHWLQARGWAGRWLAGRLVPPQPAEAVLARLKPVEECPACASADGAEDATIKWLVHHAGDAQFRAWYVESDGLCLPHLCQALAQCEDEATVTFLTQTAVEKLSPLVNDLREYGRKHDWNARHEPQYAWEQASWMRAIAFFAGEAEAAHSRIVDDAWQHALTDYRSRPAQSGHQAPAA